jgi:hypothetical protein
MAGTVLARFRVDLVREVLRYSAKRRRRVLEGITCSISGGDGDNRAWRVVGIAQIGMVRWARPLPRKRP